MSVNFEREVGAAMHRAADQLPVPRLDLDGIRRAGRRRRVRGLAGAALAAVVVVAAVVTASLQLLGVGSHATGTSSQSPPGLGRQSATASPQSSATPSAGLASAMTNVRGFYSSYYAARQLGQGAVDSLIRSRVASWYVPILEAPDGFGDDPVGCGMPASAGGLNYRPAGMVGGQQVIVVGSRPNGQQELYRVVTAEPGTGKITGITCTFSAGNVLTQTGARYAVSTLYSAYISVRRGGTSLRAALTPLLEGGPDSSSGYLHQLEYALSVRPLGYDPLLCASTGATTASVGLVAIVAGDSAGVAAVNLGDAQPVVAVVVMGAKGWMVADIACSQP